MKKFLTSSFAKVAAKTVMTAGLGLAVAYVGTESASAFMDGLSMQGPLTVSGTDDFTAKGTNVLLGGFGTMASAAATLTAAVRPVKAMMKSISGAGNHMTDMAANFAKSLGLKPPAPALKTVDNQPKRAAHSYGPNFRDGLTFN